MNKYFIVSNSILDRRKKQLMFVFVLCLTTFSSPSIRDSSAPELVKHYDNIKAQVASLNEVVDLVLKGLQSKINHEKLQELDNMITSVSESSENLKKQLEKKIDEMNSPLAPTIPLILEQVKKSKPQQRTLWTRLASTISKKTSGEIPPPEESHGYVVNDPNPILFFRTLSPAHPKKISFDVPLSGSNCTRTFEFLFKNDGNFRHRLNINLKSNPGSVEIVEIAEDFIFNQLEASFRANSPNYHRSCLPRFSITSVPVH